MKLVLSNRLLLTVLAAGLGVADPSRAGQPPDDALSKQVREVQEKGVKYLKSQYRAVGEKKTDKKGNWENDALTVLQPGGTTALALLALLESGQPVTDGTVAGALAYLRTLEPKHTYVVSLQTQVFCKANQKEDADRIKRNVKWLEEAALWKGADLQGWTYGAAGGSGHRTDNSNTRFAVAAVYAAHKAGVKPANAKLWPAVRDYYVRAQTESGGWTYQHENSKAKGTHTMTASGVLGLLMAKDILGKDFGVDGFVDKGFAWLAKEFRLQNPPHTFYNFDVIAAVGRASERKDFGSKDKKIDWYRTGAEWLVTNQKASGEWRIEKSLDDYPVLSTSFALRFLASRQD
jgi:hypothetical protein